MPDLEGVAGAAQMETTVDDQAAAHPDLTGHHVEHAAPPPARHRAGIRRARPGWRRCRRTPGRRRGRRAPAGRSSIRRTGTACGQREVMGGERRAVRADGRRQGQPDAERQPISGRRAVADRRSAIRPSTDSGVAGAGSGNSSIRPSIPPSRASRDQDGRRPAPGRPAQPGASGWISTACDGPAGRRDCRDRLRCSARAADQRQASPVRAGPARWRCGSDPTARSGRCADATRWVCTRVSALDNEVPARSGAVVGAVVTGLVCLCEATGQSHLGRRAAGAGPRPADPGAVRGAGHAGLPAQRHRRGARPAAGATRGQPGGGRVLPEPVRGRAGDHRTVRWPVRAAGRPPDRARRRHHRPDRRRAAARRPRYGCSP